MAVKRVICLVLGHNWSKHRYATTQGIDQPEGTFLKCVRCQKIDEGEGFVLDEASETDHLSESGLGIAIIRSLADELEIEPREGRGSRLRFVKHLGAAA